MRIAQILLDDASAYERKAQRIDAVALAAAGHEVFVAAPSPAPEADIAHVYGGSLLPSSAFVGFRIPYVSSGHVIRGRFAFRRPAVPRAVVMPVEQLRPVVTEQARAESPVSIVPEAVEDRYFASPSRVEREVRVIGTYGGNRKDVQSMVDRTRIRLERTRSDVRWEVFREEPSPEQLAGLDAWVDPAVDPFDLDGYVAEAAASSLVVVASRTPINTTRLEQGRTGFLVPAGDPNETTHAILAALFKHEAAQQKQQAAKQTISKFRARQRVRALLSVYGTVLGRRE
jgi:hypothetical protein